MTDKEQITKLGELLDRLCDTSEGKSDISVGDMLDAAGTRSFGTLLLLPGVMALSPLTGIPGFSSALALIVLLVAIQMLIGRKCFWLPQWILRRSTSRERLQKALRIVRPGARFMDKMTRKRLSILTRGAGIYVTAILCIAIAATMPVLDLVPFANTTAGAAITAFALALIAHDGLLAIIAFAFCTGVVTLILTQIF